MSRLPSRKLSVLASYIYDGAGKKLGTRSRISYLSDRPLTTYAIQQPCRAEDHDYIGNYEFKNGRVHRVNTPYGYMAMGMFFTYLRDYQGNNRNHADYYAYGLPVQGSEVKDPDPYLYGGKEFYSLRGVNLYDFSARTYAPDIARFMQPDPLATENHGVSPYTYCNGDPINNIDPTGCNPVYNTQGYLIGITDTGLQGEPIIVEDNGTDLVDYRKMTWDEIQSLNLGVDGLVNEEAKSRYEASVAGLPDRPDWDGYITLEEANKWYREGNGEPLYADLQKVDLSGLLSLGEKDVGKSYIVNLFIGSGSLTDALVYGTITLKRYPDHGVRAYDDRYDFDIKKSIKPNVMMRNALTVIGEWIAGSGTPYSIQFYGTAKLNPIFPWTK